MSKQTKTSALLTALSEHEQKWRTTRQIAELLDQDSAEVGGLLRGLESQGLVDMRDASPPWKQSRPKWRVPEDADDG